MSHTRAWREPDWSRDPRDDAFAPVESVRIPEPGLAAPGPDGVPPGLVWAVAVSADAGAGPDAAARLFATMVYLGLMLAVYEGTGQLAQLDDELTNANDHDWAGGVVGEVRREAAALLCGPGKPWTPPGVAMDGVRALYEAAAAIPSPGAAASRARWWRPGELSEVRGTIDPTATD